ncbi:MAG: DUF4173 domain-containing protein [Anaerolineales bacterium]
MKRSNVLWITVLCLGWFFDFLFWNHQPGISFALFVVLCLGGGFLVLGLEGLKPSWKALLLPAPILFFAAITFIRLEPMTVFLAVVFVLFLMGVLAATYLGGRWMEYGLLDYLATFFRLLGSLISRPLIFLSEKKTAPPEAGASAPKVGWKHFWAVLRGVLIALPILAIFAALLSAADPVFDRWMQDFVDLFRLERLPEYILRGVLICVVAYLLAGVFLHAAGKSRDENLIGLDKPLVRSFLGFTEAAVVLGGVVALFTVFVIVQFKYFFGGQANIHVAGFTYAEYARRGFGELVTVAFFSLLLFLGLSGIVRRESRPQRIWFSGLGIAMVALVGVMLVSAFQRLLLYEAAYGFSRLRTYTHVFMIWLGLLLGGVVVLDLLRRERAFALAALLASLGFAVSLSLLNVDGFIVRQNLGRAAEGQGLDVAYLASLSDDAVPALAAAYQSDDLPRLTRDAAGAVLACRLHDTRRGDPDWRAFHLSHWQAERRLAPLLDELDDYQVFTDRWPMQVLTPASVLYDCSAAYSD